MICKNCGYQNQEGDEFCGSCGQYLEFAGVKAEDTEAAAAAAAAGSPDAPPPPPVDDQTMAMPAPPPAAPPPPPVQAAPPPPPPPGGPPPAPPSPQFSSRGPDVICWNCGRRNPGGRTFCIQCGERLTAGKPTSSVKAAGVAGAAAASAPPPAQSGGSDNRRTIAIAIGLIVVLLVVAVGAAAFLGNNPQPSGTPVAQVTATPSGSLGPSDTPFVQITPSPTVPVVTIEPSAPPTTEPPTPTATPKVTKKPGTPPPANAVCTHVTGAGRPILFKERNAVSTLDNHTAWCITKVTFFRGTGSGLLKIFLYNNAFDPDKYGWLEVQQPAGFGGADTFVADLSSIPLPFGYDNIPPGTTVKFEIPGCNSCNAQVEIKRVIVHIP